MPTRFTHYFLLLAQLLATRRSHAPIVNIDGATAYWRLTNVLRRNEFPDIHGPLMHYRQAIKVAY